MLHSRRFGRKRLCQSRLVPKIEGPRKRPFVCLLAQKRNLLTPVDWHGYLQQQRRWARSVIDLKLRWYPRLFRSLSGRARVAAGLHGLYYLGGLAVPLVLAYLCYLLPSGQQPLAQGFSSIPLAVILSVLIICDFYRQRFYLRPPTRVGLALARDDPQVREMALACRRTLRCHLGQPRRIRSHGQEEGLRQESGDNTREAVGSSRTPPV